MNTTYAPAGSRVRHQAAGGLHLHFLHPEDDEALRLLLEIHGGKTAAVEDEDAFDRQALHEIAANEGFTVHDHFGDAPTSGYMVSLAKDSEKAIPLGSLRAEDIRDYRHRYASALAKPENYLGAWVYEGSVYLDVSQCVKDKDEAIRLAHERDQLGIFDLSTFTTIDTSKKEARLAAKGQPLYRGVLVSVDPAAFAAANEAGKARMILDRLPALGAHWSDDEDWARDRIAERVYLSTPDKVAVLLTADWDGQGQQTDPAWLVEHGVGQYQAEPEVPLAPGTPVMLTSIDWWARDAKDPADGVWHPIEVRIPKTAGANGALPAGLRLEVKPTGTGVLAWLPGDQIYEVAAGPWATDHEVVVGELNWGPTGMVTWVSVPYEEMRRRGIATALWDLGKTVEPRLHHSQDQSESGRAWGERTAGASAMPYAVWRDGVPADDEVGAGIGGRPAGRRGLTRTSLPSWRDRGAIPQEDIVIKPDTGMGSRRLYEVLFYGESQAVFPRRDQAKAFVEQVYGPVDWVKVPGDPDSHYDSVHGYTTEFNDATYFLVADAPRLAPNVAKVATPQSQDQVPLPMGQTPIPPGTVRGFHTTDISNEDSIRREGLRMDHARGAQFGEPAAIWFGDKPWYGADMRDDQMVVEAAIPQGTRTVVGTLGGTTFAILADVPPEQIVAIHLRWHDTYRFMLNNHEQHGDYPTRESLDEFKGYDDKTDRAIAKAQREWTFKTAAKGDGVDTCKFCGSDNLWGNYFDANGEGGDGTEDARWDLLCQDCGKFQIRRNRRTSALTTTDYEGEVGNKTHVTRVQTGTVPTAAVANLLGASGERPGEHRNRQGAQWESFLDDVERNGIREPIFITVDRYSEPVISEGNHRRDAAVALGLPEVPVEVRYYGHAEALTSLAEARYAQAREHDQSPADHGGQRRGRGDRGLRPGAPGGGRLGGLHRRGGPAGLIPVQVHRLARRDYMGLDPVDRRIVKAAAVALRRRQGQIKAAQGKENHGLYIVTVTDSLRLVYRDKGSVLQVILVGQRENLYRRLDQRRKSTASVGARMADLSWNDYMDGRYVARGFKLDVTSRHLAEAFIDGSVTAQEVADAAHTLSGRVGGWWGVLDPDLSRNFGLSDIADFSWSNDTIKDMQDQGMYGRQYGMVVNGEVMVVLIGRRPVMPNGKPWDPTDDNPVYSPLMGNSFLREHFDSVELVAIRYNAGWGWKEIPANGIRVKAAKTAALVWRREKDEYGSAVYRADSTVGTYEIDGNNYGRNHWTVTYPPMRSDEMPDYGMVDTMAEAKEWAEQDLAHRTSKQGARTAAQDEVTVYRGVPMAFDAKDPRSRALLEAISSGNTSQVGSTLRQAMREGIGNNAWNGTAYRGQSGLGVWWTTSQDDAWTYAMSEDGQEDVFWAAVVMEARFVPPEPGEVGYGWSTSWHLDPGVPMRLNGLEVNLPSRARAKQLLDWLGKWGTWSDPEGQQDYGKGEGQFHYPEMDEDEAQQHVKIPMTEQTTSSRTAALVTADADVEDGVMVALVPPLDVARALVQDDLVTEDLDNQHITVLYLGKTKDVDEDTLLAAVEEWAAGSQPIVGRVKGYGTFDNPGREEHVLYAAWTFEGGNGWRQGFKEAMAEVGIEDASSFADEEWTPHETLAYADEPITEIPVLPEGLPEQVTFASIVVAYGGNWSSFALSGEPVPVA